jgi:hypothetical protein
MNLVGRTLLIALALLIASPGAQARPRLGPGLLLAPLAIVGGIAGAAIGSRKARAHRHQYRHRYRPIVRRDRGSVRQARPPAARSQPVAAAQVLPAPQDAAAQGGWAGPLFWPHAYDGVFEYAFGLPGDGNQFWARGFGDVIDGMFRPAAREAKPRRRDHIPHRPEPTWENLCGSEAPKAAEATVGRISQAVRPNEAQQAALNELRAALTRAIERIEDACPERRAATPPERLLMMVARLTAMRQAVLTVRGPLRTFYDALSDEQKAALERVGSEEDAAHARADANPNAGCAAPVANWPQQQIERVLQPTKAQRAQLEKLRQTALGLAQFVASTCPAQMPRTAPERLEAVKDRLAVLRYAASNISPVYEGFYKSLSEAQRARFQTMSQDRRAENRR